MTKEEEIKYTYDGWSKIQDWIKENTSFASVHKYIFGTELYLEIYPNGECAIVQYDGSYGVKYTIKGEETFNANGEKSSWECSLDKKIANIRSIIWGWKNAYIKKCILADIKKDKELKTFKV